MTATQRVLLLPEIRRSIIEWAGEEPYDYDSFYDAKRDKEVSCSREYTLLCCGLVNKTWYREAMRILWKDLHPLLWWHNLPGYFRSITPDRRQFYANFVKRAISSCGHG
jgi:hypothetical protein